MALAPLLGHRRARALGCGLKLPVRGRIGTLTCFLLPADGERRPLTLSLLAFLRKILSRVGILHSRCCGPVRSYAGFVIGLVGGVLDLSRCPEAGRLLRRPGLRRRKLLRRRQNAVAGACRLL